MSPFDYQDKMWKKLHRGKESIDNKHKLDSYCKTKTCVLTQRVRENVKFYFFFKKSKKLFGPSLSAQK